MSQSGVLIVSASTGTGHHSAAEALREAFAQADPALHVEHVDLLTLAPRWVRGIYGTGFEMVAARAPRLWKGIYRLSDGAEQDRARWAPLARRLLFHEFRRLMTSRPWDVVLCTHFLPCQLAAGKADLPPFALVITDFTLHRYWVQPGVRRYFVATDALAADLRRRVRGARIDASGIPIRPGFAAAAPREEARAALGLAPDRPVALVIGGGLGIGVEEAALCAMEAARPDAQIVAICGRNEEARARLQALGVSGGRLRVLGYERGIERWFAAADLVATKPGGLTTSEALALGKPLLLTRPIPGAEEGNTRALTAAGAALAGRAAPEMRAAFARVFTEPGLLERLSAIAARLGRPHAARTIVDAVRSEYGAPAGV
jgi:processive 1,2-diacylglycerol beta-glucosyltransferase